MKNVRLLNKLAFNLFIFIACQFGARNGWANLLFQDIEYGTHTYFGQPYQKEESVSVPIASESSPIPSDTVDTPPPTISSEPSSSGVDTTSAEQSPLASDWMGGIVIIPPSEWPTSSQSEESEETVSTTSTSTPADDTTIDDTTVDERGLQSPLSSTQPLLPVSEESPSAADTGGEASSFEQPLTTTFGLNGAELFADQVIMEEVTEHNLAQVVGSHMLSISDQRASIAPSNDIVFYDEETQKTQADVQTSSQLLLQDVIGVISRSTSHHNAWFQAFGSLGSLQGNTNSNSDVEYHSTGGLAGYDLLPLPNLWIGGYVGYSEGQSSSAGSAKSRNRDYILGIYSTQQSGNWQVSAQANYLRIDVDSRRFSTEGTAEADYIDQAVSISGSLNYKLEMSDRWTLSPGLRLDAEHFYEGGFSETGLEKGNLSRKSAERTSGTASIELSLYGKGISLNGFALHPHIGLGLDHAIGPTSNSAVLGVDGGGETALVRGQASDRMTLNGYLGMSVASNNGMQVYAAYQPSVSEDREQHAFAAEIRVPF